MYQVSQAGPFVQFRTARSDTPKVSVSTLYCTSSCPVGATIELCPACSAVR